MNDTTICVLYGAVISIAVSILKRIPFVNKYPKVVASALSVAVVIFRAFGSPAPSAEIYPTLIECVIVQLTASVATFEIVTKPISNAKNS